MNPGAFFILCIATSQPGFCCDNDRHYQPEQEHIAHFHVKNEAEKNERETADAILRAAGGEITEGTAVYLDGTLRFVTDEGDHLRQFLYAVRAPWQTDGVQTDFVHALRLVDGIYLPRPSHRTAT